MEKLYIGDCVEVLSAFDDNSVDAVVTDPPYGLSFMGKKWDHSVPSVEVWKECLRVLKPGGHMLVACGTRTQHRMAVNIEDAGFEIRDVITWLYGSGFPKSLDVSKAIDKAAGAERPILGMRKSQGGRTTAANPMDRDAGITNKFDPITAPATDAAKQWQGWGTALKPACEFWTLCRKPLDGTVAENVQKYGTGGLNIDWCRVPSNGTPEPNARQQKGGRQAFWNNGNVEVGEWNGSQGRFPANLILDEEAAAMLDEQTGELVSKWGKQGASKPKSMFYGDHRDGVVEQSENFIGDKGGASRFFYCAKASKFERGDGNNHPTVKPIKLMRYLCRLITPPNGLVLDLFMGSGSTGVAAKLEGFEFVGIELDKDYFKIAKARIGKKHENQ